MRSSGSMRFICLVMSMVLAGIGLIGVVFFYPVSFSFKSRADFEAVKGFFFLLGSIGLVCGLLATWYNPKVRNMLVFGGLGLMAALFNGGVIFALWQAEMPTMIGTITNISASSDGYSISVHQELNDLPTNGLNLYCPIGLETTQQTIFFEQSGEWPWEKRPIEFNALRVGQRVQAHWDGWFKGISFGGCPGGQCPCMLQYIYPFEMIILPNDD